MEWVVPRLDAELTGQPLKETVRHYVSEKGQPTNLFLGELYYLSDGGYSRLVFDMTTHALQLCGGARPKVMQAWATKPYAAVYRAMIEELLTTYVQELEIG